MGLLLASTEMGEKRRMGGIDPERELEEIGV